MSVKRRAPAREADRAPAGALRVVGLAGVLALATLATFWPALRGGFIRNYDDSIYVLHNPVVQRGLTLDGLRWAFTTGTASNWHPLTWLSHMLDVSLYGLAPWGHHLTSILLHAANAVLVFLVLVGMTRRTVGPWDRGSLGSWDLRCFLVAALFALHPLRVESVAWVAERKDVLCGFFWLLALGAYVRYVHGGVLRSALRVPGSLSEVRTPRAGPGTVKGWYALALLLFGGALMAKPMAVTFPFVLLLLDWWPLGRLRVSSVRTARGGAGAVPADTEVGPPGGTGCRALLLEKLPFLVLAVVASVVTYVVQERGDSVAALVAFPLWVRMANAVRAYGLYAVKLAWPGNLSFFYPHPGADIGMAGVWVSAAGLAVVTALALAGGRRHPYVAVGWLWFAGMLLPVIGLVQVGTQGMADRYTYLPHVGLILAVVGLLGHGMDLAAGRVRARLRLKGALGVGVAAVLVVCAMRTRAEIGWWRDEVTLYRRALAVTADNAFAHFNLGGALMVEGEPLEAIAHWRAAAELNPWDPQALSALGVGLAMQGRLEESLVPLRRAVEVAPRYGSGWNNLGRVLFKQGDVPGAIRCYREAVRLDPRDAQAAQNLAQALAAAGG